MTHCILWGNQGLFGPEINISGETNGMSIDFCDIAGGRESIYSNFPPNWKFYGSRNIDADPLFVDAAAGDYHLSASSPCINAGDPAFAPAGGETDLDGDGRVLFGVVDMGTDEAASFTDCNGNGVPDWKDLADGTSNDCNTNGIPDDCERGICTCIQLGDVDGSGVIDQADLHAMISLLEIESPSAAALCSADLDEDGDADRGDLDLLIDLVFEQACR